MTVNLAVSVAVPDSDYKVVTLSVLCSGCRIRLYRRGQRSQADEFHSGPTHNAGSRYKFFLFASSYRVLFCSGWLQGLVVNRLAWYAWCEFVCK